MDRYRIWKGFESFGFFGFYKGLESRNSTEAWGVGNIVPTRVPLRARGV